MNCISCNMYTQDEVIIKNDGLCSWCFNKYCFCMNCSNKITFEVSKANNKLCESCFKVKYGICKDCKTVTSLDKSKSQENRCDSCYKKLLQRLTYTRGQVKNTIGYLNKVLFSFLLLSASIILLKVTNQSNIKFLDVTFSISNAWLIFAILSIAHSFLALILLSAIKKFLLFKEWDLKHQLFDEITSSDNIFFNGLVPKYSLWGVEGNATIKVHKDIHFVLYSTTFALIAIAAIITIPHQLKIAFGISFSLFNFFIASSWTVNISRLTAPLQALIR
jgi:hypothetical protein